MKEEHDAHQNDNDGFFGSWMLEVTSLSVCCSSSCDLDTQKKKEVKYIYTERKCQVNYEHGKKKDVSSEHTERYFYMEHCALPQSQVMSMCGMWSVLFLVLSFLSRPLETWSFSIWTAYHRILCLIDNIFYLSLSISSWAEAVQSVKKMKIIAPTLFLFFSYHIIIHHTANTIMIIVHVHTLKWTMPEAKCMAWHNNCLACMCMRGVFEVGWKESS